MDDIFRAKRIEVTPEQVEQVEKSVNALNNDLAAATGQEPLKDLDFDQHAKAVKDLSDKLIDVFEATDYSTTVALDALEAILRGGVQLTMGDEAGALLERHLRRFHHELGMLQIINLIGGAVSGRRREPKQSLEELLREMRGASEKRNEEKS